MPLARGPVVLRAWETSEAETLYRLVTEAQDSLRLWMPWAAGTYLRIDAATFIARSAENRTAGEVYSYAIVVDGVPVGTAGMERNEAPDALEIGYWLHPAHTGHGYATIAASLLVDEAFTLPWVARVQIWHDVANTASAAIPRRLGFTEVARRSPPREPAFGGEKGIDVIWELTAPPRRLGDAPRGSPCV
jgi:RimJ/RimL family protein N-acetyltransferase